MNESMRFRQMYRQYADLVFSHAFYCLGSRHDAEDAAQEVFLRMWKQMPQLDADRAKAWLLTVTHRLCIDMFRKRRFQGSNSDPDSDTGTLDSALPDPVNLEQHIADRDTLHQVYAQLERLSPDQRSVVLLRCREGLSYAEISDALSLSPDNVKVLLHRGRRALRQAMQEEVSHD
jgi:RNA polymerase sigma factor (sigma-70 family)